MRQKTGGYLALGALFSFGALEMRPSEDDQDWITILVYDYAGINHETLLRAEGEADQIIRHAGAEVV
jgi:hemin uptake protein HemP